MLKALRTTGVVRTDPAAARGPTVMTPGLSRAIHMLGLEQKLPLQARLAEALDDLLRKYGRIRLESAELDKLGAGT